MKTSERIFTCVPSHGASSVIANVKGEICSQKVHLCAVSALVSTVNVCISLCVLLVLLWLDMLVDMQQRASIQLAV